MTFKEYVATRRITDTPQGDFTGDARRDNDMPDVKTWDELKSYLQFKVGRREVIEAARLVWQGYIIKQRSVTENV